ncbi:MAG: hypothetical protein IKR75_05785 [Fibrobacter sp.]|jgi:hypothetical protein|uniref:hypothetical protein n=1 Tax=Fibrobacter sp. TaxID=35828 RepID=UPI001B0B0D98|nr:hypothetical protein [Fibrobacter sp.]MBO4829191.1 hypothetical protein [Fibrobacter sp.]MBO7059643.1 hypothetical protein [Fibrobacter sp.]MBO7105961.1 hypothetical protein [Fibrobacter sp.]MBO7413560.1 hypothetical protein [Fibrobacter sp.]MBO7551043.1 hypothetical protein [Fibrobacter sp.]
MSRSERRRAKQNAKNFVPKKSNALDKRVIVLLAVIAVVFFVGTMLIQRGA